MKFTKYSLIAAIALSGALVACNEDDSVYAPGAPASGNQFYFPITESASVALEENATTAKVVVARIETEEAATVGVSGTVTDATGAAVTDVFTIPSTVSFAAGQAEAELVLGVNFANVVPDAVYSVDLKLNNGTTPYGASTRTFAVSYAPWTDWKEIEDVQYFMNVYNTWSGEVKFFTRSSIVNPNNVQYGVADLFYAYDEDYSVEDNLEFIYNIDLTKTVDVDGVECPLITTNVFQLTTSSGSVYLMSDVRTWLAAAGYNDDQIDRLMAGNGMGPSYFNPKTGQFCIDLALSNPDMWGTTTAYSFGDYDYVQLPGYANYEIMLDYVGNFVDARGNEFAIISADKTDDVASFTIDIFKGAEATIDIDAAVEDMKANEDLEVYTDAANKIAFTCPDEGAYTVIAIGNNAEGETAIVATYEFNYATVKAENKWTSIGYAEYTEAFISDLFNGFTHCTWDVEVQEHIEQPGLYRIVNPYVEWPELMYDEWLYSGDYYIVVDATNPNQVYLPLSEMGISLNSNYGMFLAWSDAGYDLEDGVDPSKIEAFGTMKDGVITFPVKGLLLGFADTGKLYYANQDGSFCLDLGSAQAAPKKAAPVKSIADMSFSNMIKSTASVKGTYNATRVAKSFDTKDFDNYRKSTIKTIK